MHITGIKRMEHISSWILIAIIFLVVYLPISFAGYLLIVLATGLAFNLLLFNLYKRLGEEKAFVRRKKWPFLVGILVTCYLVIDQYLTPLI